MDTPTAAARFSSLGHELRLELFRRLVQAGGEGLAVGQLQAVVDRPASTVAFHLRELVDAGLVRQGQGRPGDPLPGRLSSAERIAAVPEA
jgi:ArsR family transcriptional regulator, arsenate/arsenite/antimonite-responsive transcriptional repressor